MIIKNMNIVVLILATIMLLIVAFCPDNNYAELSSRNGEDIILINTGDGNLKAKGDSYELREDGRSIITGVLVTELSYDDILEEMTTEDTVVYENNKGGIFIIGEDSIAIVDRVTDTVQVFSYAYTDLVNALVYYDRLHFCPARQSIKGDVTIEY